MEVKEVYLNTIKLPEHILRSKELLGDLTELADSIAQYGLLHPVVVTPEGNKYLLIAGYRRIQACKKIGLKKVPAHILEVAPENRDYITLVENQQRHDVNPYDEAIYFKYLYDERGLSQTDIARMISKTQAYVSQRLSLLELDELTLGALVSDDINLSQAMSLGRMKDVDKRQYLLEIVAKDGATKDVITRWVDQYQGIEMPASAPLPPAPPGLGIPQPEPRIEACNFCGDPAEAGGLQTLFACTECYRKLKASIVAGVSES